MLNNREPEISYTDITLAEADGIYEEVKSIMESELTTPHDWMIQSTMTIFTTDGMGQADISCWHDGKVYITKFQSSSGLFLYNPEVPALSSWARDKGWKVPQPSVDLIKEDKEFWKHWYDTLVVDSDYFDTMYGKRPQIELMEEEGNE